jgi:hypothetical protein
MHLNDLPKERVPIKNFGRAGIAFIPLMIMIAFQMMPNKYFKMQSDYLLV